MVGKELKGVLNDLMTCWRRRELWLTLGWRDVLSKYRRSWLGPLWITLSMGIVAGVMGALYSAIMKQPPQSYIPFLTVGFIAWNMLSALVTDGSQVFVSNAAAIKEIPVPNTIYVFRVIWRNAIIFAHNLLVYVAILIIFQISPFPAVLLSLPAIGLILLNGLWLGLLFGSVNARFRDFSQLINNLMRLVFFVTPIIWYADLATGIRSIFVHLNPFYYFIEILRGPLLGQPPGAHIWIVVICITIGGWAVTLPIYAWCRRRIAYWV